MAGFLKNRKSTGSAKRNPARSKSKTSRRKVPGTNYYKTSGGRYQNAKGKFVKASAVKKNTRKRPAAKPKRRVRRNASVGYTKKAAAGYDRMKRSAAAKKAAATRKRRKKAAGASSKRKIGKYTRLSVKDPRTGKSRRSYMYRTPKGKRRRIPAKAIIKSGTRTPAQIKRGRQKAAARIKREGSAFVANGRKKGSARQKRSGRRVAAYRAALAAGKSKSRAKQSALKKVPLAHGDTFMGTVKVGTISKGKPRRARGKKYVANKRRRKTVRKNARRKTKRSPVRKNARRRVAAKRRSPMRKNARRRVAAKRRSPKRRMRRNARRTYRRNPPWLANFRKAFVSGMFVGVGFITHKVIVNLSTDPIFDLFKTKDKKAAEGIGNAGFNLDHWKKPIVGAGVLAIGIPVVNMIAKKRAVELGAGMVASWLHSLVVSASLASKQEKFIQAVGADRFDWSGRKWPYRSSRAAALRGLGNSQHLRSIGPRYTPVNRLGYYQAAAGQYQQAAAGQYQQAAAGQYQQAAAGARSAAGEYYTPMNATGEYFADGSTQGVGSYEGAGPLALPRNNQQIEDGIRPDSNLDRQMDIMEAAAGLRGGLGSYFEAGPNGQIDNVPTQSQWVPNGEMWAGELKVNAGQQTSELSAGILNVPGGNGVLSGG